VKSSIFIQVNLTTKTKIIKIRLGGKDKKGPNTVGEEGQVTALF